MTLLSSHYFEGPDEGPRLLVLGAVHGNEPCGTKAIQKVLEEIEAGQISITKGSVTFIPICNPKAYEQNVRYVESNLNRHLYPKDAPRTYEDNIANELCPYLKDTDLLLDIHSYRRGGPAFGFISPERNETELKFLQYCNLPFGAYGFGESYKAANVEIDEKAAMGTREYALSQGGIGITVECGQHDDPQSIEVAYQAIHGVLNGLGFIEKNKRPSETDTPKLIQMKHVIFKEKEGRLVKPWKNFEPVSKDELLAIYDDNSKIISPCDGVIVLPDIRDNMPPGEEWLYIGSPLKP